MHENRHIHSKIMINEYHIRCVPLVERQYRMWFEESPQTINTSLAGFLFIVPIERTEEGGKKKLILATLPLHIRMESTRVVSLKTGRGKPYYSP